MEDKRRVLKRHSLENPWVEQASRARFGCAGLRAARNAMYSVGAPFARAHAISKELLTRLGL